MTYEELKYIINVITNETRDGANTAKRIGTTLLELAKLTKGKADRVDLDSEIARAKAVELELLKMIKGEEGEILIDGAKEIDIVIEGDNLLALGETKKVRVFVKTWYGEDVTKTAKQWKIERISTNPDADKAWGARQKAKDFAAQAYVPVAEIELTWSSDSSLNDLDPNLSASSTSFRITATIDDTKIIETIEI